LLPDSLERRIQEERGKWRVYRECD